MKFGRETTRGSLSEDDHAIICRAYGVTPEEIGDPIATHRCDVPETIITLHDPDNTPGITGVWRCPECELEWEFGAYCDSFGDPPSWRRIG